MQLRAAIHSDLDAIDDIDATIESTEYLHVERAGEGLSLTLHIEPRPLREKLIQANRLDDETRFAYRQIIDGHDEGECLIAEHGGVVVGAAVAIVRPAMRTLHVVDLRVDSDVRREGLATAMLYQIVQAAKDSQSGDSRSGDRLAGERPSRYSQCRAVFAEALANRMPANLLLHKCGFELSGVDTRRTSNHDLAREITTLLWYAPLD